jgi:hypothetical protein
LGFSPFFLVLHSNCDKHQTVTQTSFAFRKLAGSLILIKL